MARTIQQIQQLILDNISSNVTLSGQLTSTSQTAIWKLCSYIVAVCQWTLETLFDQHVSEVTGIIDNLKPHSLRWYANMAKAFQYGYALVADEDYYDNTLLTSDQVTISQIVNYSAVIEQEKNLRIKVATTINSDLAPLNATQLAAFTEYMSQVKDAGVKLVINSESPDSLLLTIRIFYNPLVLDSNGARLDGTSSSPVQDAINAYLQNLPFNGWFVVAYLIDALQAVDGVIVPVVDQAQATYGTLPYQSIDVKYNPDSGYLRIINPATDLDITFIPQSVIK
ncbi:MAG: nucleotidyltransferase [Chitinophagaceae bacterium]|nr:MAG: nucleotidyltransferase [Chitinophagaceae bacterium]